MDILPYKTVDSLHNLTSRAGLAMLAELIARLKLSEMVVEMFKIFKLPGQIEVLTHVRIQILHFALGLWPDMADRRADKRRSGSEDPAASYRTAPPRSRPHRSPRSASSRTVHGAVPATHSGCVPALWRTATLGTAVAAHRRSAPHFTFDRNRVDNRDF